MMIARARELSWGRALGHRDVQVDEDDDDDDCEGDVHRDAN